MNKIKYFLLYILLAFLFVECGSTGSKKSFGIQEGQVDPLEKGVCIIFYKLDDYARIYINNDLVYDTSETVGLAPKNELLVDLNPFLSTGQQDIKVELYNGQCTDCNSNRWVFIYELYQDSESLEFVSEDSNDKSDTIGLKLTQSHSISIK